MTLSEIFRRAQKLAMDNSPTILTTIGAVGAVTTAYLTGVASYKAANIIRTEENKSLLIFSAKERVALTWKLYIPALATGLATVSCIIAANRIGTKRAAALAASYTLLERGFSEYREKIVEKLGAKKELVVRDEIAQDRINRNPPDDKQIIITDNGSVLCMDAYTGRYFLCDMETIKQAVNQINYQVLHDIYASLSDFYELIGLPATSNSDEVGWNADMLLTITYTSGLTPAGKPCLVIDYSDNVKPLYNRIMR